MLPGYLLRILFTLARSWFAPKVLALEAVRLPLRIWPTDLDIYGHMNNGRYLTLMDMGRLQLFVCNGLGRLALKRSWLPVVGAASIRFRRELRVFQKVELLTRVASWDERWVFIEHRLERDGELCALAVVKAITKSKGKTVPPVELLAAIGGPVEPPVLEAELARIIQAL